MSASSQDVYAWVQTQLADLVGTYTDRLGNVRPAIALVKPNQVEIQGLEVRIDLIPQVNGEAVGGGVLEEQTYTIRLIQRDANDGSFHLVEAVQRLQRGLIDSTSVFVPADEALGSYPQTTLRFLHKNLFLH